MKFSLKRKIKKNAPLLWAFLIPFIVMFAIFISLGIFPFGENTLLTIDLGQQYIDFFVAFKQTLLHEPSAFFHSFNKSIGGDMIGLWAYYLTSPFNILLLPFPDRYLPVGVMFLTLVKISCASLSFAYLLKKTFHRNDLSLVIFGISYALMGYMIVSQLNIMWLDGLVFLPLIALGVEKIICEKKIVFYSIFLGITLFANYYIGYMICLFITLYFLWRLFSFSFENELHLKEKILFVLKRFWLFTLGSLLGASTTAVLMLPNIASLQGGKGSYTSNELLFKSEYPVWEMISKFYIGAFNFEQMPHGYPNLFIGSLGLICFILFFFNRQFSIQKKIGTLLVMIIFVASMNIQAIDYFWHGLQAPIWYPYRFSFVVSFFMLFIGYESFIHLSKVTVKQIFMFAISLSIVNYFVLHRDFDFLPILQVGITTLIMLLFLFFFYRKQKIGRWFLLLLLLGVTIEMGANAGLDLNHMHYVKNQRFVEYRDNLDLAIRNIRNEDTAFYRIEKTFLRSKNDSFQTNYPGVSHFSSTFEKEVTGFFSDLGMPTSNGFVTYSNGTLFTDAFLGIKYYLSEKEGINRSFFPVSHTQSLHFSPDLNTKEENPFFTTPQIQDTLTENASILGGIATKPDLTKYQLVREQTNIVTYENPDALPIAFGVNELLISDVRKFANPILYQNYLINKMMGKQELLPYFIPTAFHDTSFENIRVEKGENHTIYHKIKSEEEGSIHFKMTPQTNDSYYLALDSSLKKEEVTVFLNERQINQYDPNREPIVLNVGANQKGKPIAITIKLNRDKVDLKNFKLYRLDSIAFHEMIYSLKSSGLVVKKYGNTFVEGTIHINEEDQVLLTTIPYSTGWQMRIDGKTVPTLKALDALLAVPIKKGTHDVLFSYTPPLLTQGIIVSLTSIGILCFTYWLEKKKSKSAKN